MVYATNTMNRTAIILGAVTAMFVWHVEGIIQRLCVARQLNRREGEPGDKGVESQDHLGHTSEEKNSGRTNIIIDLIFFCDNRLMRVPACTLHRDY